MKMLRRLFLLAALAAMLAVAAPAEARNQYVVTLSDATPTALKTLPGTGYVLVIDWVIGQAVKANANTGAQINFTADDDAATKFVILTSTNAGVATGAATFQFYPPQAVRIVNSSGDPISYQVTSTNTPHVTLGGTGTGAVTSAAVYIGYHYEP